MNLVNKTPSRIFAFGCSFTDYFWTTWPEIVAFDLNVPHFSYGKSGAGNQYIANSIVQANLLHKFTEDDLIIVSWTNVCREDRWRNNTWVLTGNIYTQNYFDENFIKEWADPVGYMVRDFASINLIHNLLKSSGCQYHMLSMCDIADHIDQTSENTIPELVRKSRDDVCKLYKDDLDSIHPSFFKCLWHNNIYNNKILADRRIFGDDFSDGHPSPIEHLSYLKKTFPGHKFRKETNEEVERAHANLLKFIDFQSKKRKGRWAMHELSGEELATLKENTTISRSLSIKII